MISAVANQVLNRVIALHSSSLIVYLNYAQPAMLSYSDAAESLRLIAEDQLATVEQITEYIIDREGVVDRGEFPMAFTALHDLSFEYLLPKIAASLQRQIEELELCAAQLSGEPTARALAEEALGAAKGHLDTINEMTLVKS